MEENQLSQNVETEKTEPMKNVDNSANISNTVESRKAEDKSSDPSALILGKFKSTEDLTEAYRQLEKLQGNQSSELGALREKIATMNSNNEVLKMFESIVNNKSQIQEAARKYPDYFADPSFKQLYTEAFMALGPNLDADRLVNLIEGYASARIFAYEKAKASEAETKQALDGIKFDKNDKTVAAPVRKSIQQMTPKELDEMLDKLI